MTVRCVGRAAVAIASASLATGCGSGAVANRRTSATITRGEAVAYANAVNLRARDVGGVTRVQAPNARTSATVVSPGCEAWIVRGVVAEVRSPSFHRAAGESVSSRVVVAATPGSLAGAAARLTRAGECLTRAQMVTGRSHSAEFRVSAWAPLTTREIGIEDSFGFRYLGKRSVGGQITRDRVQIDMLGFVVGRAEVTPLSVESPEAPSASEEVRLLALLHGRAEAHRL